MPKPGLDPTVRLSVLDRLLDEKPGSRVDAAARRDTSVAVLREALRRDLEWLLNTRRAPEPVPEELVEVMRSMYRYGLPDITALSRDSADDRRWLRLMLEEAVAIFEPRLEQVRVVARESSDDSGGLRALRFVVEGMLRLDPNPVRVKFDVREAEWGEYRVKETG